MANRKQRRAGKRLLNRPELKKYIDQFCMEISNVLVDTCEEAKKEAELTNQEIDFTKVQKQLETVMLEKGEQLGNKVKEIVKKQTHPQQYVIKTNLRAKSN